MLNNKDSLVPNVKEVLSKFFWMEALTNK
jgi:hypothetical protein